FLSLALAALPKFLCLVFKKC
nr:RecName: Full=Brevinin-1DYa [Rana dybowskii]